MRIRYHIAFGLILNMITNMDIRSNSPEKFYASDLEGFVADLTHIGRYHMSKALPPLEAHTHARALEIVYVRRGQLHYEVGGVNWTVNGGDVFLAFPDEIHGTGKYPEERADFCWIGVNIDSRANRFLGFNSKESLALRQVLKTIHVRQFPAPITVSQCIDSIIDMLLSDLPYRRLAAQGTLLQLLTTLLQAEKNVREPHYSRPVVQVMELIEDRAEEPISLQDLADGVHLSLPHLKKIFREETGMPPYEYVLLRKMEKARELLSYSELTVTDIAFQLGFPSSQHFATMFKKMNALTPTDFRKQNYKT